MVNFPDAISLGFKNYTNFTGTSSRAEYWWWILFYVIVQFVGNVLDLFTPTYMADTSYGQHPEHYAIFTTLFTLALILPTLAVAIRRLRDAGRPWYNIFWGLVPLVGNIILIYKYVQPSLGIPSTSAEHAYRNRY